MGELKIGKNGAMLIMRGKLDLRGTQHRTGRIVAFNDVLYHVFVEKVKLPSLTDIIVASKIHPMKYHKMKKRYTGMLAKIFFYARRDKAVCTLKSFPILEPVDIIINLYEKNNRRDKDNALTGAKFILDAIKQPDRRNNIGANIIVDDRNKYIHDLTVKVRTRKENWGIELIILKAKQEEL